jgi:hypothetical protein
MQKKKKNSNSLTYPFVGTSVFIRLDRQKNEAKKKEGFFKRTSQHRKRQKGTDFLASPFPTFAKQNLPV